MAVGPELIAEGIPLPEGPVWCEDGTLVVTAVAEGALYRIWPEEKRKVKIADTRGGANAALLAADGAFVVTQNGGVDWSRISFPPAGGTPDYEFPPLRPVSPGLQRVAPDGTVTTLLEGMQAPNDLVAAADGTVYFTDPANRLIDPDGSGRVMAYRPDGTVSMVADGFEFCNGIVIDADGSLIVTELNGLVRLTVGGMKRTISEDVRGPAKTHGPVDPFAHEHVVDGMALDVEGRLYMAAGIQHGIRIMEGGGETGFMPLPGLGSTTNCCFGGPDNRTLFVTDGIPGSVWMWRDLPAPGLPVHKATAINGKRV